jgi:hypothetical protein
MQRLIRQLGIIAIGAVIMVLAGCDLGPGPGDERLELDLPPIAEETRGQTIVTGTNIALEAGHDGYTGGLTQAFVNSLDLAGETNQNGVTWSVTDGKLTFSLETPSQTDTLDAEKIAEMGGWTNIQVNPADAQAYLVGEFKFYKEVNDGRRVYYNIERGTFQTDANETYYSDSEIIYLYVSRDVAISGQSGQDNIVYTAFNLSLKAGWNLLQKDGYLTPNDDGTVNMSIATKNVPWTVKETGVSSGNSFE